jgi:DnaJ-class molecular chaperone
MNSQFQKIITDIRNGEINAAVQAIQTLTACGRDEAVRQVRVVRGMFDPARYVIVKHDKDAAVARVGQCGLCSGQGWVIGGSVMSEPVLCPDCGGSGEKLTTASLDEVKAAVDPKESSDAPQRD